MAFVELTKEENPKLAVQVNNSLKYQDKDGNLKDRQKPTALLDIVREASSVAGMDKGAVMLSLNTENGFKNYFVNKNKNEDIVLAPMDKALQSNKDEYIYFNKKVNTNEPDKYFYSMSKSGNAEKIVDSIKVNTTDKSAYLGARVTLSNKDLLQDMIKFENDSGEKSVATIGKDTLKIETMAELQARRETLKNQEQNKSKDIPVEVQDKNGNVVEKTTTPNAKAKSSEDKKKAFKPQSKSKSKEQDIER
ncbi:hypothetical protein CRU87_06695 [Aliarcobacter trophiarum LMG 25534]|uniref:Uncharacterized protein n=1 Tax=Aliarcobacter trophiarum LMG 25534 TaxID=1032241 RepID=A0AAD0QJ09_9BACT|nr:hypothetical protein [Aliarcobacter trophiarum]AXK48596.1 hypothetical protein ATR_0727 [Aliarcobacter trophiarum LMG 25534]RXJ91071.1 hypothetical protein CRU87_06695 [Aliarcobacter trophiarum LMG 25534]